MDDERLTCIDNRLAALFDDGEFTELNALLGEDGHIAAVVTACGFIEGEQVYAFAQNSEIASGGFGRVEAIKIARLLDLALKCGAPVIGIYDSNGAKLSDGIAALSAYGDILGRMGNLSGVVPQLSLVLGPCAGCAALIASSADFVVMSGAGEIYLSRDEDGKTTGSAAAAFSSGVAHIVHEDESDAIVSARRLISLLPRNNLSALPAFEYAEGEAHPDPDDPLLGVADYGSAVELSGGYGDASYTALTTVCGRSCGIVATNGQALADDDCAKIAKLVSVCDAFSVPVVTLLNVPGFAGASDALITRQSAKLAATYAEATTPKVTVITGEAYGAACVALAGRGTGADLIYAWPQAAIAPLAPDTAVAILLEREITKDKSRGEVESEYKAQYAGAKLAAEAGYIDGLIKPEDTRCTVIAALDMLEAKRVSTLPKKHANLPI